MLLYRHICLFLSNDCVLLLADIGEIFPFLPPRKKIHVLLEQIVAVMIDLSKITTNI